MILLVLVLVAAVLFLAWQNVGLRAAGLMECERADRYCELWLEAFPKDEAG